MYWDETIAMYVSGGPCEVSLSVYCKVPNENLEVTVASGKTVILDTTVTFNFSFGTFTVYIR